MPASLVLHSKSRLCEVYDFNDRCSLCFTDGINELYFFKPYTTEINVSKHYKLLEMKLFFRIQIVYIILFFKQTIVSGTLQVTCSLSTNL